MAPDDLPREPTPPGVSRPDGERPTDAELEALEDAADLRLARERSRLAKIEGTVSWESIKAEHGLTDAELDALEDAEDLRLGLERLRRVKTEGTILWEAVKAKYGL